MWPHGTGAPSPLIVNPRSTERIVPVRPFILSVCLCAMVTPALAQPFANATSSLATYTRTDTTPHKPCDSMVAFKEPAIVSIQARMVEATAQTPQHCRVTGFITPEVGFEVSLPERWNRRFYMTGNGGLAG